MNSESIVCCNVSGEAFLSTTSKKYYTESVSQIYLCQEPGSGTFHTLQTFPITISKRIVISKDSLILGLTEHGRKKSNLTCNDPTEVINYGTKNAENGLVVLFTRLKTQKV